MIEAALYDLLNEAIKIEKLLSGAEVDEYFTRTATFDNRFNKSGNAFSFGSGSASCLLYTCDPAGESAGGTALVSLVNLLQRGTCNFRHLPVSWHFAPNLDLSSNQALTCFRKMLKELKPDLVCTMNAARRGSEPGARFFMRSPLPDRHSSLIRAMFEKSGVALDGRLTAPIMGAGFKILKPAQEPLLVELPPACQFFRPELDTNADFQAADQVYLLMAANLVVVDSLLKCDITIA